jgi:L-amino acid N-acyltransferase YncA
VNASRAEVLAHRIRGATEADIPRITDIYAHYVETSVATFEETPPNTIEIAARFIRVTELGLPWLVAEDAGGVQGYAYAAPFRDRSAYRFTVEDSIYIAPDQLRRGYGGLLLTELIARCEDIGKRQMIAVVGGSESSGSISLHSQLGFRVAGVLPSAGFKFGAWADSVLMTRTLGEGDASPPADDA